MIINNRDLAGSYLVERLKETKIEIPSNMVDISNCFFEYNYESYLIETFVNLYINEKKEQTFRLSPEKNTINQLFPILETEFNNQIIGIIRYKDLISYRMGLKSNKLLNEFKKFKDMPIVAYLAIEKDNQRMNFAGFMNQIVYDDILRMGEKSFGRFGILELYKNNYFKC